MCFFCGDKYFILPINNNNYKKYEIKKIDGKFITTKY